MSIQRCGHCEAPHNMHQRLSKSCGFCGRPMMQNVKVIAHALVSMETCTSFIGSMASLSGEVKGLRYYGRTVFLGRGSQLFTLEGSMYESVPLEPTLKADREAHEGGQRREY